MKLRFIISFISLLLVAFVTFTLFTFSWFDNTYNFDKDILGRTRVNYFAAGEGSQNNPFIINKPEHMFNLSMLQNLGYLEDQDANITGLQPFYFKVANTDTGDPIVIDFSDPSVPEFYRTIPPIGDHIYPFIGIFDGNFSVLQHLTIDGIGKQDIGFFGYLGTNSLVKNLFIESPTILSNPIPSEVTLDFHVHNDDLINRATGYIVGHLGIDSLLENVFVIDPTINSLSNGDLNRSQYGLIGFNESDGGMISASPRNSYNFVFDGTSANTAIAYAKATYANWYVNGGSSLFSSVFSGNDLLPGYSLSTLRISQTINDPNALYLIDKLEIDGYIIGTAESKYSRENIDLVGDVLFSTSASQIQIFSETKNYATPQINATFDPLNYSNAFFLYVRPSNNLNDLGDVTGIYSGGGNFAYISGYDSNGNYIPGRTFANSQAQGVVSFGASGVTNTLRAVDAFTAVKKETDPITNEEYLRVISGSEIPDYYVFLLAVTNGQIVITQVDFKYQPQAITEVSYEFISQIDFIHKDSISSVISNLATYEYSMFNFNYDMVAGQDLMVNTQRLLNGDYNLYIDYAVTDDSLLYFDIFNVTNKNVNLYINNVFVSLYTETIIEIRFTNLGYTITVT